ncbi:hypothetical protein BU17DRAFT_79947 [Hysterangium stoloniferum]|nr:hypothetical protein BU17DRAFT_79947 [Hysterangium stoloniferum]
MSLHSYPSLISDATSSSTATSDPLLPDLPLTLTSQHTPTRNSSPSITVSSQYPQNPEICHLRTKVSKLEQDKFLLEDYATELQSRIRQLEQDRINHRDMTTEQANVKTSGRLGSRLPKLATSSQPGPTPPSNHLQPKYTPLHRPSNSLSAATSAPAKRAVVRRDPPGPSQIPTTKGKLVPKRGVCVDITEAVSSVQEVPVGASCSQFNNVTPTRRRLQAMIGLFSPETVPHPTTCRDPTHNINGTGRDNKFLSQSLRVTKPKPPPDNHLTKRTAFTSKLDSIVLTSKLFPLPSSRIKAPHTHVSPEILSTHTSIPLAPSNTTSTPQANSICLDSPPSKNFKAIVPRKSSGPSTKAQGTDLNSRPDEKNQNVDRRPSQKSRVSFSDRLFSSSSTRIEDEDADPETAGKIWGSWSKKKQPLQPLVLPKEARPGSPSRKPISANSVHFKKSESTAEIEDTRKGKRRSLAPQYLRSLVTSSNHAAPETQEERGSRSRGLAMREDSVGCASKDDKKRINPSRVGSPTVPKSRLPEPQTGTSLQRTSSMRSAGKWGQRGRGFSSEFTRGRTVHPMFSFERPGGSEATSTTSSKETIIEVPHVNAGASKSSKKVRVVERDDLNTMSPSEFGVSHPNTNSSRDNSTSERTSNTGVARSDPGLALRAPMMHTRQGAQAHGTFAFEPAAAVIIPPRPAPRIEAHNSPVASGSSDSLPRLTGVQARSFGSPKGHVKSMSESKARVIESHSERKVREYAEFCEELKVVLGDGADWTSFMNYVRRFDLHVLSADVFLQRVKKLIDGHRSVDGVTRTRLYERFAKIVHDSDNLYG